MKKRIIVSTTNDIGTDNRVHKVCILLLEMGFDVLWVGRKLPGSVPLQREYKTHRFNLIFNKGAAFYANYNIRLFFFLLWRKADVLLANDLDTLLANFLASKLKRSNLVYDSHEYFLGVPELENNVVAKGVWQKIERFIFPKLKHIFTVNDSIAQLYFQDYGMRPTVFRNISLPPQIGAWQNREYLGLPKDKFIFINQGSGINVDRGMEEALLAVAQIQNAVLLVVGSGDVVPDLKKMAAEKQLQDRIIFVDKQPYAKLLQYTHAADVGLSLDKNTNINYRFSLPNKLFDYIYCGIPVLTSSVVEVKNVVEKYKIGKIVAEVSPASIASAMQEFMAEDLAHYTNNLQIAAQACTWQKESIAVKKVYAQFL